MAGDSLDRLVLQHLKSCSQTQYDTGFHRVTGLSKQVEWGTCRMAKRQLIELGYQLPLTVLGKQLIYRSKILLIETQFLILVYHQDQRLQQIAFTVVPEMITLTGTGIADNDVGQNLSHQGISVQV